MSWADHVNQRDLDALGDLAEDAAKLQARIRAEVSYLRQSGVPWSVIAEQLGVSKQGAQQRYGSVRTSLEDQPLPDLSPEDQAYVDRVNAKNAKARAKLAERNQHVELRP